MNIIDVAGNPLGVFIFSSFYSHLKKPPIARPFHVPTSIWKAKVFKQVKTAFNGGLCF